MRSPSAPSIRHDLVLVGGGHAHIQVLKRWAMAPVPGARLTVVVDRPIAVYSGMVPGFVAGQYPRDALEIDVRPLALRGGRAARPRPRYRPAARRLLLDGRPPSRHRVVRRGLDVGGLEIPARASTRSPRPIGEFVGALIRS
jgi:selenide,water dikinase